MKTIIFMAKDSNTNLILSLLKQLKIKAKLLSDDDLEDAWLARLIDEGMKEKGEVPISEIHRKLRK